MYGGAIQEAIRKALAIPENRLPLYPRKRSQHIEPAVRRRMKVLKAWRDEKADTLQLDPSIVFSKAQITVIAGINPKDKAAFSRVEGIKRWQHKAFGGEILQVLTAYNARGRK